MVQAEKKYVHIGSKTSIIETAFHCDHLLKVTGEKRLFDVLDQKFSFMKDVRAETTYRDQSTATS